MSPFLHDQEVAEMCKPLRQAAAIRRYLSRLGVPFQLRPDGRPLVSREAVTRLLGGAALQSQGEMEPNLEALQALFRKKRRADG